MGEWTKEKIEAERQKIYSGEIPFIEGYQSALSELSRLQSALAEAREDAERLSHIYWEWETPLFTCVHCDHNSPDSPSAIAHADDCPITLHRNMQV